MEESAKTAITAEGKGKRSLARMVAVGKKEKNERMYMCKEQAPHLLVFPQYYPY